MSLKYQQLLYSARHSGIVVGWLDITLHGTAKRAMYSRPLCRGGHPKSAHTTYT